MNRWQEPAPGEHNAGERSWDIVRAAFEERVPARPRRDWRPFAIAAVAAAIVAAALSPPGLAVLGSLRDAVQGEENARPALFSLPSPRTRLLVNSAQGAWVVQSDGSKRLLQGYHDATWSPHGLYLAAIRGHELRALEPDGDRRWSIGRPNVALPRWSSAGGGDERVAYLAGGALRVVGGDGRDDHLLAKTAARVAAAWRPRSHVLAFADADGRVVVADADTRRTIWTARPQQPPVALEWSRNGRYLLVRGASSITIFGSSGRQRLEPLGPGAAPVVDAAFAPSGDAVAFVQQARGRSVLWFYPRLRPDGTAARRVFAGAGTFGRVIWSPDGRWLLLGWRSADQWLFIRSAAVRKVIPVSGIEDAFGPAAVPAGWCCP
jgi:WD40 repeat protein